MASLLPGADAPPAAERGRAFYMAAWRWHFYAGIYVAPFLMMLAVTGLIMLYVSAFVGLNGERMTVPAGSVPMASSALADAAAASVPDGRVTQSISPLSPGDVAVFRVEAGEAATAVQVNPYTAQVVGQSDWDGGWYPFATDIHGSLLLGDTGDRLIEIAAGVWRGSDRDRPLPLVATRRAGSCPLACAGPAGARTGAVEVAAPDGGVLVGLALLLVFLISGLSWTGIWGDKLVQAWKYLSGGEMGQRSPVGQDPCRNEPRRDEEGALGPGENADARLGVAGRGSDGGASGDAGQRGGLCRDAGLARALPGEPASRRDRRLDCQPRFDEQ